MTDEEADDLIRECTALGEFPHRLKLGMDEPEYNERMAEARRLVRVRTMAERYRDVILIQPDERISK